MKIVRFALIAYEVTLSEVEDDIKELDSIVSVKNLVSRAFTKGENEGESTKSFQEVIHKYITTDLLDEMKGEIECSM